MPYPRASRFRPNAFQSELIEAALTHKVTVAITAVRTGKTGAVAFWHRTQAKANPGVTGIWIVQTYKWYRRVALPVCKELFGHEARYHGTDYTWTFPNGAKIIVVSAEYIDDVEGITAGWGSVDECQNVTSVVFEMLAPRISDRRARFPTILITGLPTFDNWAEALAEANPAYKLFVNVGTGVNAGNIHTGYIDLLRDTLDPEEFLRRTEGKKPLPKGRVFDTFIPDLYKPQTDGQNGNLLDYRYSDVAPLYACVDWGFRRPACVFNQALQNLDVWVGEYAPDNLTTEEFAHAFNEIAVQRGKQTAGDTRFIVDKVFCDPAGNNKQSATGIDDINVFRKITGCQVDFTYNKRLRSIPYGIRLMKGRILSASGKRRQLMTAQLWEDGLAEAKKARKRGDKPRSLALSLINYKYPEAKDGRPISDEPVKDGLTDHHIDAMRYDIVNRYGKKTGGTF